LAARGLLFAKRALCLHYESAVCARFELTNDDYTPNKAAAAAAAQRAHNHEYLILSYANPRDEAVLSRLLMRYLSLLP